MTKMPMKVLETMMTVLGMMKTDLATRKKGPVQTKLQNVERGFSRENLKEREKIIGKARERTPKTGFLAG